MRNTEGVIRISLIKKWFGAQDMTVGSPMKNLAMFSIPLLVGNIAQQLYNTVDSIVVGRYIGDGALGAVGVSGPLLNLLLVLFMGISTGAGIMVSQYFGAKERTLLSKTVGTTITLIVISSLIITILGPLLARPMLELLNTPPDIIDDATTYLVIIFIGIIGGGFYNIVSGILRGLGDSMMPLLFLLVATGLNIALDICFVAGLNMGVAGVAYATIIAQGISAVLCVWRLMTMKETLDMSPKMLKPDRQLTWQLCRLGLPAGITQVIFSLSMILVQALTNSMGSLVIAANTMVMRVDGFAMMPNFTFGMAMSTFVGQNIGANRLDRVDKGTRAGMMMGIGVSVVLVGLILIFGDVLLRLFTDTPEVIALGIRMLRVLAVGYVAMAVTQILSGVIRGAGDTMSPMWISMITTVLIRMPLAYLLAYLLRSEQWPNGHPDALYFSLLSSWVLGALVTFIVYRRGKWRTKGLLNQRGAAAKEG